MYCNGMFIRQTIKCDKRSGKKYSSYQLVESVRTENGPRQNILLTIGSDLELSPEERKLLANRIEEIISGVLVLFSCPEHIEGLAQHFAKKLTQKIDLAKVNNPLEDNFEHFVEVDINTIRHENVRTIGAEHIAYSIYQELNLDGLFCSLGFSKKQREAAAATIIGRAVFPASERGTHLWLLHRSGLDELMGKSFGTLSLDQLYRVSDEIVSHKSMIEKHLSHRERTLFHLQESIILYDITNTFFEGTCKGHSKAKRGKSKEKRSDSPLLALGMILDSDGFPKHSEIFEGNVNERATLQEMILRLNKQCFAAQPIIVMDSGIATQANVEWLKSQNLFYIVMMKKKFRPHPDEAQDVVIRDNEDHFVSGSLRSDDETGDNFLYCYSEQRKLKEQDIKVSQQKKLEDGLEKIRKAIKSKGGKKNLVLLQRKIGRLKQQHSRVCQHYDIVLTPSKDGIFATEISWTYDPEALNRSFNGTYSMRTNMKDLDPKQLWNIYMMLSEAEACFKCLKSDAGLRPNYHKEESRIDGHIFISILAYHLIACIQMKLKKHGLKYTWSFIREQMHSHVLVSTKLRTKDKRIIFTKSCSEPEKFHKEIYSGLGIGQKPIKMQKIISGDQNVVSNF